MIVFTAKNSNDMANKVYTALNDQGISEATRNGPVLRFPEPVTMCYTSPWERMNFTPGRKSNPFFHLAEAAWMLAGRRDVEMLTIFNKRMIEYSDDGKIFNAAYGYRLRRHFGHDQLKEAVDILKHEDTSRQVVLQIWDHEDLTKKTKDKACNLSLIVSVNGGKLQMMVVNRSNDVVYGGVTGANPVHMSFFQQYLADKLSIPIGRLYMVSNNVHVYTELYDHWTKMNWDQVFNVPTNLYPLGELEEYEHLCEEVIYGYVAYRYKSPMIEQVLKSVFNAWLLRKSENHWVRGIQCPATFKACNDWLLRTQ